MSEEQEQQGSQDNQSEYLKFVGLLALLLAIIFCMAILVPPLFSNAIPAALGLEMNSSAGSETIPPQSNSVEEVDPEAEPADSGPGNQPLLGPESLTVHTVQEGETLNQIALNYNVSLEALAAANNIINPQQLAAGSVLIIPQPQ